MSESVRAGNWAVPPRGPLLFKEFRCRMVYAVAERGGRRRLAALSSDLSLTDTVNAWIERTQNRAESASAPAVTRERRVILAEEAAAADTDPGRTIEIEEAAVSVLYTPAVVSAPRPAD